MHKSNRGAHGHCDWQACLSLCLHVLWKRVTCSPLTWRQFVAWAFQHALGSNCTLAGFAVWSQNAFASVERWRMAASSVDPWNQWSQEKPWRDFDSRRRQESWCGMIQTTRDAPFGNPAEKHLPEAPGSTAPRPRGLTGFPGCTLSTCADMFSLAAFV